MSGKMTKKQRLAKAASGRKTWGFINTALGSVAFLTTFTGKDRAQYSGSWFQKGKTLVNNLGGRLLNVNPFNGVPKFTQITGLNTSGFDTDPTIKITGGLIAYGIAGSILKKVPVAGKYIKLPLYRKIGRAGGVGFGAAILGKLLDAPGDNVEQYTGSMYETGQTIRVGNNGI